MHRTISQPAGDRQQPGLARARMAECGHCWQQPGTPCTPEGDHLARWLRAERRGLITRGELTAVVGALGVIAGPVVIPERAA